MKKIKIKVSTSEIQVLNIHLEIVNRTVSPYRQIRVLQSVLMPLSQKLLKRSVTIDHSNEKKSLSLSYHEAHYLETFLRDIIPEDENPYNANVILKIRNELNQLLS